MPLDGFSHQLAVTRHTASSSMLNVQAKAVGATDEPAHHQNARGARSLLNPRGGPFFLGEKQDWSPFPHQSVGGLRPKLRIHDLIEGPGTAFRELA